MKIFGLNITRSSEPRAQTFDLSNMSPEDLAEFLRIGGGMSTTAGASVTESSALRLSTVWACVNLIADSVATLPLDLVVRGSETERRPAVDHPLRRLLTTRPNHWQTPSEFRRLMQKNLLLRGNAYAQIVRSAGRIQALIPLHPDSVAVEQRADGRLLYTVTKKDGGKVAVPPGGMLHLRGLSADGITGISPLHAMREAVGLSLRGEEAAGGLFRRGFLAGGTFIHPGQLSPEAEARFTAQMATLSGAENASRWILLEEGMKAEVLSLKPLDLQFLEQRDFQRIEIAIFFRVPPHLVGITDKSTSWGTGIEQQNIGFLQHTLNPWLKTWEEALKRDLLPEAEWDTHDFRFYVQGLLRGDAASRVAYYSAGIRDRWLSPNEVRALEDMNPRPGGDVFENPNTISGAEQ